LHIYCSYLLLLLYFSCNGGIQKLTTSRPVARFLLILYLRLPKPVFRFCQFLGLASEKQLFFCFPKAGRIAAPSRIPVRTRSNKQSLCRKAWQALTSPILKPVQTLNHWLVLLALELCTKLPLVPQSVFRGSHTAKRQIPSKIPHYRPSLQLCLSRRCLRKPRSCQDLDPRPWHQQLRVTQPGIGGVAHPRPWR